MEGIERRGEFDQARHVDDQVLGLGLLPGLAVHLQFERELAGIWDLVGRDHPGAEHAIGIDGLAQRTFLGAAHGHVESDRIARDIFERLIAGDPVGGAADHGDKLDLMVVAAVELAQPHAFRRPDDGAHRLQKQPRLLDLPDVLARKSLRIVNGFFEMLHVIYRRGHDLGRVRDRGVERHLAQRSLAREILQDLDLLGDHRQRLDHRVAARIGPMDRLDDLQGLAHIENGIALDEPELVTIEPA